MAVGAPLSLWRIAQKVDGLGVSSYRVMIERDSGQGVLQPAEQVLHDAGGAGAGHLFAELRHEPFHYRWDAGSPRWRRGLRRHMTWEPLLRHRNYFRHNHPTPRYAPGGTTLTPRETIRAASVRILIRRRVPHK